MNSEDRTACGRIGETGKTSPVVLAVVTEQLKIGHEESGGLLIVAEMTGV